MGLCASGPLMDTRALSTLNDDLRNLRLVRWMEYHQITIFLTSKFRNISYGVVQRRILTSLSKI
jgi:hypothetical protein